MEKNISESFDLIIYCGCNAINLPPYKPCLQVLSLGIDGWKCDGTDPYLLELGVARGNGGVVTRTDYSNAYYGDFFDYTRAKLGDDRLIMSRPVDG